MKTQIENMRPFDDLKKTHTPGVYIDVRQMPASELLPLLESDRRPLVSIGPSGIHGEYQVEGLGDCFTNWTIDLLLGSYKCLKRIAAAL